MNSTIDYYNNNAENYYVATVTANVDEARQRFAAYLPVGSKIVDMGCGSGRDVHAFNLMGFDTVGLDASEELLTLAEERLGIKTISADLSSWISDEPYDGIWCCASLLHLDDTECRLFFANLEHNLKPGGVLYISVKSGITTGTDEVDRYMRNFTEEELKELVDSVQGLAIKELWYSEDTLHRNSFRWLNAIMIKGLSKSK